MNSHLTIASVQMFATTKQETNLKTMEEYLIHINAAFPKIDLVVFPELSSMSIGSKMAKQAQPIPGELTDIFAGWAKKYGVWLIPGSMYESSDNNIFNSTPVFSSKGKLMGNWKNKRKKKN